MNFPPRLPPEVAAMAVALAKSPDAVFITDRMSRIVEWNQGAARLLGFSEAEALGESCAALLGGCDGWGNRYCTENCPVKEMAARGEPIRPFDLRYRTREPGGTAQVDLTILQLAVAPPSHFFLVHLLRQGRGAAPAAPREEEAPKAGLAAGHAKAKAVDGNPNHLGAPMPGMVVTVAVKVGQVVKRGDPLVSLEAMKMETVLSAERDCTVHAVHVRPGETIQAKDLLLEVR